jgi:hypothetical protein
LVPEHLPSMCEALGSMPSTEKTKRNSSLEASTHGKEPSPGHAHEGKAILGADSPPPAAPSEAPAVGRLPAKKP